MGKVVQEVCLAPQADVMCGSDMLQFKHIMNLQAALLHSPDMRIPMGDGALRDSYLASPRNSLVKILDAYLTSTWQFFQVTVDEVRGIEDFKQQGLTLLAHVWSFRKRRCEDPRDRVYALLNLTRDVNEIIFPDYDTPLIATYARSASAIMTKHRNLEVRYGI